MIDQSSKPFAQYMILQNQAYHEERLLNSKPKVDNKWRDLSLPNDKNGGSRKQYLNREKFKEIENGNLRLLSRIYNIIFDKNKEFASKYNQNPKEPAPKEKEKENNFQNLSFHPFSNDNKIRTLNLQQRKKETNRINFDNVHLLKKLKDSKPTVFTIGDMKERQKNMKNLVHLTRKHTSRTPNRCLPSITQRHINPVVESYLKRHDLLPLKGLEDIDQDIAELKNEADPTRLHSNRNKSLDISQRSPKKMDTSSSLINDGYSKRPKMPRRKKDSNFSSDEVRISRLNKSTVENTKNGTSLERIDANQSGSKEGPNGSINGSIKPYFVSDNAEKDIHSLQNSYIQDKTSAVNQTVL